MSSFHKHRGVYKGAEGRKSPYDLTCDAMYENTTLAIFAHGYKGFKDWGPWPEMAVAFAEKGVDLFKFNFSHNGGTVREPIDFPDLQAFAKNTYSKEVHDLHTVIQMLQKGLSLPHCVKRWKRICLIGHSRGGGIATLCAAAQPRVEVLVTWASVADFGERFNFDLEKWKAEGITYVQNARTKQLMPHSYSFYEDYIRNEEKLDILYAARKLICRALVIHARDDEAVEPTNALRLADAIPKSTLKFVETGGHTFGGKHPSEKHELPDPLKSIVEYTTDFILNFK